MTQAPRVPCLPFPDPIPLTEATWRWWTAAPSLGTGKSTAVWWERHRVPLTIPQLAALRLGRPIEHVSMAAMIALWHELRCGLRLFEYIPLRGYDSIWNRSHRGWQCRVTATERACPDGLLGRILAWARPGEVLDSRFFEAGLLTSGLDRRARRRAVCRMIRRGCAAGYLDDVQEIQVPAVAMIPGAEWMRQADAEPIRIKRRALEHSALAVEAALMLLPPDARQGDVLEIWGEETQLSRTRRSWRIEAGAHLVPTADVEVRLTDGRRLWTEVLSRHYRNPSLATKYASLPLGVSYVATGQSIAKRFATVCPGVACYVL